MSLKILMCCHLPLDPKLGGAKVYLENAEAYESSGHQVKLLGIDDFGEKLSNKTLEERLQLFPNLLRDYLDKEAHKYDVVEYEYLYLPFTKPENAKQTLFVARSVLLEYHLNDFELPKLKRNPLKGFLSDIKQNQLLKKRLEQGTKTLESADFINVPNEQDKERLIKEGFSKDKIIVSPYGTFGEGKVINQKPKKTNVAYIASFDPRKGCLDLSKILNQILTFQDIDLYLFGTKGRFQSKEEILSFFPKEAHNRLHIQMTFDGSNLDKLLENIGLGIFPSYLESFGFGLIELTSRGIPVIAYDVPGPSDLLPKEYLVSRGDWKGMAQKILKLQHHDHYQEAKEKCFEHSKEFVWKKTVKPALEKYLKNRGLPSE